MRYPSTIKCICSGKESNGYQNPYNLFNEYMTWALYVLYCHETYPVADFKFVEDNTVNYMVKTKGFPRFKEFADELLRLFTEKKGQQTVSNLYPRLLDWCASQN